MQLKNKIAVVTGVSQGIGYHSVRALLRKGAIVYGLGRNKNNIRGKNYHFIKCDVRVFMEVEKSFKRIFKETKNKIHVLLNNAGLGYFGNLEDISIQHWHEMFETNVNGIFHCCKMVLPVMKKNQEGHIINIASTAALEGYPQVSAYCSSKWAVRGLSESLYKEVRDEKIKVTCIYPASTKTGFFKNNPNIKPHDYMLMPEDVAKNILQVIEMPENFHTINIEIRPLQPKGPKK
ncbi:MAG: SDR family oxidoreductase [Bacteroidia bacterium]